MPTVEPPSRATVASLMPQLKEDLARLVAIPSISEWGFPEHTRPALLEAHQVVVELFRAVGVDSVASLELDGTAPVITGEIPGPEGAPHRPSLLPLRRRPRRRRGPLDVASVRGHRA